MSKSIYETNIPFTLAVLAKVKGFFDNCESHYEESGVRMESYGMPYSPNLEPDEIMFSAPTYTVLSAWLLKNHKINTQVIELDEYYTYSIQGNKSMSKFASKRDAIDHAVSLSLSRLKNVN